MRWFDSRAIAAGIAPLLLLGATAATAEAPRQIEVEILVSHLSDRAGDVDPRLNRLHDNLKRQFRYESLRVLDRKKLALRLGELGSLRLPNGRTLRLRPMQVNDEGVLMAVDLEGSIQLDLRVPNRKLVVVGPGWEYEDGRIVVSLEPRY